MVRTLPVPPPFVLPPTLFLHKNVNANLLHPRYFIFVTYKKKQYNLVGNIIYEEDFFAGNPGLVRFGLLH